MILALRLLSPAGFMPSFEYGSVTIVACPDVGFEAAHATSMHHHSHGKSKDHQPCPYASASSLGALGIDLTAISDVLILVAALLLGRTFRFIERHSSHLRPPLRAPPIPA